MTRPPQPDEAQVEAVAMRVEVHHYWRNMLVCWHGKGHRRVLRFSNGVEAYCSKCQRKLAGISEHAA